MPSDRLYSVSAAEIDYDLIRQFVIDAEAANLFTESLTFEAKEKRNNTNVAEAVGALSNSDGGIVLVGVKDKGAIGEDRIVGVPQAEHDTLVTQLHNLIPSAMPEVIPVAIPGADDLIVIVLRVDADAVLHPVIVSAKVQYRIPGQKAAADRQRIIDMLARDNPRVPQAGPMQIPPDSWQPQSIELWPESVGPTGDTQFLPEETTGELRVVGGLTLPSRILDRPWLDSRAKQAAADALNNAPLRSATMWSLQTWRIKEARSGHLEYESAGVVPNRPVHAEARAYVRLAERSLAVLVAFRWQKVDYGPLKLSLETFHDLLLATMITAASTSAHVAKALGADAPVEPRVWEAWFNTPDYNALSAIDISRFDRDNDGDKAGAFFPAIGVPSNELASVDRAARNWLTYWLLEIGTRGFEEWLENRKAPDWIKWPELG
jgi:hypothetical protein